MIHDTFVYEIPGYEPFMWDVTIAQQLVAAGAIEATIAMPFEDMAEVVSKNDVVPEHVDRVDPTIPGIAAPIINPCLTPRGISYVLIDGTHRCAKALRQQQPFIVYLLTDVAARRALLSGPADCTV